MSNTLVDEVATAKFATLEPITVEQYHAMIKQGILLEGSPIELIDGLLVRKDRRDKGGNIMTVGPRHASTIIRLTRILSALIDGPDAHTRSQQPVTLDGTNEPEPDLSVVSGDIDEYAHHHPGPGAIALVIEVADSSLSFDRGEKFLKYASAGIPTYWIVNLNNDTVETYTRPQPKLRTYQSDRLYQRGDKISVDVVGKTIEVAVDDFLAQPLP